MYVYIPTRRRDIGFRYSIRGAVLVVSQWFHDIDIDCAGLSADYICLGGFTLRQVAVLALACRGVLLAGDR